MPIELTEDPAVEKKLPIHPFHLVINVKDLDSTRSFYDGILGATEGRSTSSRVDFDLFGHQISFHIGPVFKLRTQTMLANIWSLRLTLG